MFATAFAGLWPLVWHFSLGGIGVAACLAAAWFSPVFKKDFIWAAAVIAVALVVYTWGVANGEHRIRAQWDAAVAQAEERAQEAHAGAERDVARKPIGGLRNDRFNRDKP